MQNITYTSTSSKYRYQIQIITNTNIIAFLKKFAFLRMGEITTSIICQSGLSPILDGHWSQSYQATQFVFSVTQTQGAAHVVLFWLSDRKVLTGSQKRCWRNVFIKPLYVKWSRQWVSVKRSEKHVKHIWDHKSPGGHWTGKIISAVQ